jgi:hypothetical protein
VGLVKIIIWFLTYVAATQYNGCSEFEYGVAQLLTSYLLGQDQKKLFVSNAHCFAHNSKTKAATEKVNAPFCSTN